MESDWLLFHVIEPAGVEFVGFPVDELISETGIDIVSLRVLSSNDCGLDILLLFAVQNILSHLQEVSFEDIIGEHLLIDLIDSLLSKVLVVVDQDG